MVPLSELLKNPQEAFKHLAGRDLISQTPSRRIECEKCRDTGVVLVENNGHKYVVECGCAKAAQERKATERRLELSGIAEAFKDCRFDRFEPWNEQAENAKEIARAFVNDFTPDTKLAFGHSLMLCGGVGSGKTMLGVCVLNALLDKGVRVFYAPYREMAQELKSTVTDEEAYNRALAKYTTPTMLFMDDLYKGATANDPKYVYDVVNARYLARRGMIVTSELYADAILAADEAVGSRLLQMAQGYTYELRGGGLNYRLRGL